MPEAQTVEYKESWREEYLRVLAAFANTDGGQLLIGVDDRGRAVGAENAVKLMDEIPNHAIGKLGLHPYVEYWLCGQQTCLKVTVEWQKEPVYLERRLLSAQAVLSSHCRAGI